jgi:ABC-2 type transport system ATP-binding protein
VIETESLTRRFGEITAVRDLALRVPRGSVYGFLGPNGAGKSTSIRMLLGLVRPNQGAVRLFGKPLGDHRIPLLRRVGALVEKPSFYPHLTGRENLEVTRRLIQAEQAKLDRALALVDLSRAADRPVKGYSTGMKQRLGLALALLGDPELLILDEPTSGLDPQGIREIRRLLSRLPDELGVTVFLSSHLLHEVEQIATHLGILRDGRLLFQGTHQALQAELKDQVTLGVSRPGEAARLLEGSGWKVTRNGQDQLRVSVNGRSDAALINSILVKAKFNVYRVALEKPSLEDIFLGLTDEHRRSQNAD